MIGKLSKVEKDSELAANCYCETQAPGLNARYPTSFSESIALAGQRARAKNYAMLPDCDTVPLEIRKFERSTS